MPSKIAPCLWVNGDAERAAKFYISLFPNATLVLCTGHVPVDDLSETLEEFPAEMHLIGDAASPRTAEEAVYEGHRAGMEVRSL